MPDDGLGVLEQFGIIVEDSIRLRHHAIPITQEGIGDTHLLHPCLVCLVNFHGDAQHLGIGGLELGQIQLEGQRFRGSEPGKSRDVEE